MKNILVGISYSELTSVTLKYSLKLAQYFGANLTVVHIAKYPKALEGNLRLLKEHATTKQAELEAIFSKYPKFQRKNLQTLARIVLYHFICKSPAKYKDAKDIIFRPPHYFFDTKSDANRRFEEVESIFNEEILNKTMFPSISNPRLWITQTKLVDPTLRRNSSYSYVINK